MRAVGVMTFGGPEQLQVLDIPVPEAGQGEVRIRVHGATVNPTDIGLRSGAYGERLAGRTPPFIPGMDASGTISQVGHGAGFSRGDAVIAIVLPTGPHGGAYADQVVVPAASVVARPAGCDALAAATLPMNGLTARISLDQLELRAGQTLVVTGAAGAYGGYVLQLAHAEGLTVIADGNGTDEDAQLLHQLGADHVVPRGDDFVERVRRLLPDGADGVADGAVLNERVSGVLRDGGAMAVVRGWSGDPGRGIKVHSTRVFGSASDTAALDRLRRQVEQGILTLRVARSYRPDEAADAHRALEAGGVRGRLVLDFS